MTGLRASDLAEAAGVSLSTVRRAEDASGAAPLSAENAARLVAALEALGVVFLPPDGDDLGGVRFAPV